MKEYPKLAALPAGDGLDRLIAMTPYLGAILTDDKVTDALTQGNQPQGETMTRATVKALGLRRINALVPVLLRDHRDDLFGLLGAYFGETLDTLRGETYGELIARVKSMMSDESVTAFFN